MQSMASTTPNSTSAILFHQTSRQNLPTLRNGLALLRPSSSSTTYPHGGTAPSCFEISNHVRSSSGKTTAPYSTTNVPYIRAILLFQPRHCFLRQSHLATLFPPRHLNFHFPTTSCSGTPSFNVHKQVAPNLSLGYDGRNLTCWLSGRNLMSGVGYRRPEPQVIFNTFRSPLTSGQGNASLTLG